MGKHVEIEGTPSIVLLKAEDEKILRSYLTEVAKSGIKCYAFFEPDIGHQMTAFATRPLNQEQRKLLKHFKLVR